MVLINEKDILGRIALGEDSLMEFKSVKIISGRVVSPDGRQIANELSAMANSTSGRVLFGVDDKTRRPTPLSADELDVLETWVRTICNDMISPRLDCVIRKIPVGENGCGILCVEVPQSLFVHKGAGGYFTRIGSSRRELTPDALARLFQQRGQTRIVCFDEQIVAGADIGELSPPLFRRFRTPLSDPDDLSFLRKIHFVAPDVDGVLRPTVAGLLMACEHPEKWLHSAFIQAVAYRGAERTADSQLDARDITGPLDVQVLEAVRFVNRNMRVFAVKETGRIDIPQFSLSAVFEAVVNAVVHRDYSVYGSKIRLHMFSDRIEIFSPGGLPNSLTLDELSERQFTRNELICSVVSRCEIAGKIEGVERTTMMDRRGEGVPIILGVSERVSGRRPEYRLLDGAELKLTIYSVPGDDGKALHNLAQVFIRESMSESKGAIGDKKGAIGGDEGAIGDKKGAIDGDEGAIGDKKGAINILLNRANFSGGKREKVKDLYSAFGVSTVFGRREAIGVVKMNYSAMGKFLSSLLASGIIVPVKGQGKGRYRFNNV